VRSRSIGAIIDGVMYWNEMHICTVGIESYDIVTYSHTFLSRHHRIRCSDDQTNDQTMFKQCMDHDNPGLNLTWISEDFLLISSWCTSRIQCMILKVPWSKGFVMTRQSTYNSIQK